VKPPQTIFEDASILIIDKPSGWVVNDATTTKNQPTIQSWLRTKNYPLSQVREKRSGIVHRLDKETSGILIIAKTTKAFENLQQDFKKRNISKKYLALVHGKVMPEKGSIKVPVARLPWNRERFGVLPGGRPSETSYRVDSYYQKGNNLYSLLNLQPKTGRTHQIRIHLKHLGHPVVSDPFYAGRKTARTDRAWCPRLFLHASQISFTHPSSEKKVNFQAPLPPDLEQALSTLQPA
jgi:23S rRNA pseudouridine1911/1915/1917 synthase